MKCSLFAVALVGSLLSSASTFAQKTGALAAQTGWYSDLEQGRKASRQTGKPIFLVFRCEP